MRPHNSKPKSLLPAQNLRALCQHVPSTPQTPLLQNTDFSSHLSLHPRGRQNSPNTKPRSGSQETSKGFSLALSSNLSVQSLTNFGCFHGSCRLLAPSYPLLPPDASAMPVALIVPVVHCSGPGQPLLPSGLHALHTPVGIFQEPAHCLPAAASQQQPPSSSPDYSLATGTSHRH